MELERFGQIFFAGSISSDRGKGIVLKITLFPLHPSTRLQQAQYVLASQLPSALGQTEDQKA
jgi:hypothetical protein